MIISHLLTQTPLTSGFLRRRFNVLTIFLYLKQVISYKLYILNRFYEKQSECESVYIYHL